MCYISMNINDDIICIGVNIFKYAYHQYHVSYILYELHVHSIKNAIIHGYLVKINLAAIIQPCKVII